ncbi:hypothetical protein [Comamonas thiooxydans]|uniref:hypothetical protein n=1 Tax=Comamonas thiooxydans TaxID=363952 RepID=UPI0001BB123C|nr:hypothetical protein [Comamonas thiooxydans]ACY32269.1 hypothetical protein CtCNB1_1523 [Comamonas thiooxydans]MDO1476067.1 hypothetical protein [Comamonas thiooxydans]
MIQFHQVTPTRQAIRDHYDTQRDPIVSYLLRHGNAVVRDGWDVFEYFDGEGIPFLHQEQGVEDVLSSWIADHIYGQGDIQIDADSLRAQLSTLKANAGAAPDLDAISDIYLWVWWRVHYLDALLTNQQRGIPLGNFPVPPGTPYTKIDAPALPLHILNGQPDSMPPTALLAALSALVADVEKALQTPIWVPVDATRLLHRVSEHYDLWVDWLDGAGVQIEFNTHSLAVALDMLRQPAGDLPGYVGPQYRYGVSYPAAMFLVAQTLALGAQEPQYVDHSPNERT